MHDEGKKEDSSQIDYETKMIQTLNIHIDERLPLPAADPQDTVERNALLEAHLIHSRNLIDFFFPGSIRDDDILLSDFVDDLWTPSGPSVERLGIFRIEIHKRLVHLTRHRNIDFTGWPSLLITGDLMTLVREFLDVFRQTNPELGEWLMTTATAQEYFHADYRDDYHAVVQRLE